MTARSRRILTVFTTALAAGLIAAPAGAGAAIPDVFDGEIACVDQGAAANHVRFCGGEDTTVPTWDGITPIDVNVALPPEPTSGNDGPYPMVMIFHGWGGSKVGFEGLRGWAEDGYAVFSMSDRGWGLSCGASDPKLLTPECADGYNHLMDTRYEVRDAQYLAGMLVDDGVAIPNKIGATGPSYGGGMSMALAALRNRVMLPDDTLVPWTSPQGTPVELAAAQPDIPWTDMGYSLTPNGHTLDYVADAPYFQRERVGVLKQSYVSGLYLTGLALSNYAPAAPAPGSDPDADLTTWYTLLNAGEPYDTNPATQDIVEEVTSHHSSYYIDHSQPPAPLLISSGWTDDLFPADEAIRFYNRTRTQFPGADVSLLFSDAGHARGQNKAADSALRAARIQAWFAHYLKGEGAEPAQGVEVLTQTCPSGAASGGPYTAPSWAQLAPGEVRFSSAAAQTVSSSGAPAAGTAFDPITGGGACATAPGADFAGTGSYRLPAAPSGGYTLLGSPTVIADIDSQGANSQVAARLLDVAPNGDATLIARALYRPDVTAAGSPVRQVFQLHPNGWEFAEGHVAKLELLTADSPYGRASNGQQPATVSNLELRLPVLEQPQDLGGGIAVQQPAPKLLPAGYALAAGFAGGTVNQPSGNEYTPKKPKKAKRCKKAKRKKAKGAGSKKRKKKRCKAKRKRRGR
jgi:predicted acyl esterase